MTEFQMSDDDEEIGSMKEAMRLAGLMAAKRSRREMAKIHNGAIELRDEPLVDDYGTVTIGTWGGYLIQVMPMLINDRLVMTPQRAPDVYDFGWCFMKGGAAFLAAAVWDPGTEAEPQGFKKRIGPLRKPGEDVEEELSVGEMQAAATFLGLAAVTE